MNSSNYAGCMTLFYRMHYTSKICWMCTIPCNLFLFCSCGFLFCLYITNRLARNVNKVYNNKWREVERFSKEFKTVEEVLKEQIMNHNLNKNKMKHTEWNYFEFNSKNRAKNWILETHTHTPRICERVWESESKQSERKRREVYKPTSQIQFNYMWKKNIHAHTHTHHIIHLFTLNSIEPCRWTFFPSKLFYWCSFQLGWNADDDDDDDDEQASSGSNTISFPMIEPIYSRTLRSPLFLRSFYFITPQNTTCAKTRRCHRRHPVPHPNNF